MRTLVATVLFAAPAFAGDPLVHWQRKRFEPGAWPAELPAPDQKLELGLDRPRRGDELPELDERLALSGQGDRDDEVVVGPDEDPRAPLADGRLVRILEGRERSPLTLSVLYPSRQHVPAKTRLFIDYIVEQLE